MTAGLYDDYARLARQVRETRQALDASRATAESGDGLIIATVSGRGDLLALTLDPRIYRHPDSAALAASITGTVTAAVESARRRAFELNRPFLPPGADPATTDPAFDPFLHHLDRRPDGDHR